MIVGKWFRFACILIGLILIYPMMLQGNPLMIRINGKEISYSDFRRICERDSIFFPTGRMDPIDRFIDFCLMVEAARQAGMDTLPDIRQQVEEYRRKQSKPYLLNEQVIDKIVEATYKRMATGYDAERVQVCHVFRYLPQNASARMLHAAEVRMDSIYEAIQKGSSFEECVRCFSDEKQAFWVGRLQMPIEFEDVVFRMKPGQISKPFFTPQGIHIVKVLAREEIPPFPAIKDSLIEKHVGRIQVKKEMASVVEKLKKDFGYNPDHLAMQELYRTGHTTRTLFVLGGKPYTGVDFNAFAAAHPGTISRQIEDFISKSVLDLENSCLEQKYPELAGQLQVYQDSLLAYEIYRKEVYEKNFCDDARLKSYFETHRAKYDWKEPRYRGLVVHAVTKRMAKQVRKFLKKLPEAEWNNAVRLVFNADGKSQVSIEYGTFAVGENAFVDELVFKKRKAVSLPDHPFTVVEGKRVNGPESYQEIRDRLLVDYYQDAGLRWLDSLRAVSKVEINQEVLKTVNNH